MKKFLLLFLILFGFTVVASAHPDGKRPDPKKLKELRDYKVKYIAQEIELKDDQKAKFVELYEKMSEEKRENFESMRAAEKKLKKSDASEAEYKALSEKITDCRIRDAQIDKEYDTKFAKFLTQKQIYKMKAAEEKFRKKMMDMHLKRKNEKKK